jgi:hypothetical protein
LKVIGFTGWKAERKAKPLGSLDGIIGPDQHQSRLKAGDSVVIRNSWLRGPSKGLRGLVMALGRVMAGEGLKGLLRASRGLSEGF